MGCCTQFSNDSNIASKWREGETGRKRKYYTITDEGRRTLSGQRAQWKAVNEALAAAWGGRGGAFSFMTREFCS
jgi:PadR family transcriptional regulator PadR